jgi:hypothetical protein
MADRPPGPAQFLPSEQRGCSEPVGRGAQHSLGRQRDCEQLFLGVGRRRQLEADGHAGVVSADRHRDRAEAEIVDPSRIADDAAIDPRWLSASATSDISGGVKHKVGDAMTSTASRRGDAACARLWSRATRARYSRALRPSAFPAPRRPCPIGASGWCAPNAAPKRSFMVTASARLPMRDCHAERQATLRSIG